MKSRALVILVIAMSLAGSLLADHTRPIVVALDLVGKAKNQLEAVKAGGGGGKKKHHATINNVIGDLNRAETKILEAKNNKGSNSTVAMKFIDEAKTELEGAKSDKDNSVKHLEKASVAIEEAFKRVKLAVAD